MKGEELKDANVSTRLDYCQEEVLSEPRHGDEIGVHVWHWQAIGSRIHTEDNDIWVNIKYLSQI